ncbi:LysR family transcriptional regulator [Bradyrhizobium sp.]|uniref:LysR family transcriptional regulator n=1 Tax=Bradyrhizobium sp. TaxID=376 RepID=UPI003C1ECCC6
MPGQVMDRVSSMLSFVKVVDTGGFRSAARQLNLATSVVTTRVKSIEARLGVRLLNRTTRSVSLTEAGRAYYDRCVQILSEIENAEEAAQVLRSGALVPILSDFLPKRFSIDAFYPHREHLPAKVRTFIDLLVDDLRQIDWDPCAQNGQLSSSPGAASGHRRRLPSPCGSG